MIFYMRHLFRHWRDIYSVTQHTWLIERTISVNITRKVKIIRSVGAKNLAGDAPEPTGRKRFEYKKVLNRTRE